MAYTAVGIVAIAALLWGWRVRAIEVTGATIIPNAAVRDAVLAALQGSQWGVFPRTSMLLMRTGHLERTIRDQFAFSTVSVRRRLNGEVRVSVTEQSIVAVVRFLEGAPMLLAGGGRIIAPAPESLNDAQSLLDIRLGGTAAGSGGQIMSADALSFLRTVWEELRRTSDALQPEYLNDRAEQPTSFDIHTINGAVVSVTADEATERQLTKLRAVLQNYRTPEARAKLRIIDLRYGDRVYVQ
ncbi:MAG: hypothetical protein Q7S02_02395 [bacterium]|nr:hypothetical protein [bacterium]